MRNKDILKKAWRITKDNLWFLVAVTVVFLAVSFMADIAGSQGDFSIISSLLGMFLSMIMYGVYLRLSKGEEVDFSDLLDDFSFKTYGKYILATILITLFSIAGFVLLVIPGLIVATALAFTYYILLDDSTKSTWGSIKESWRITKGMRWRILGFWFVLAGVNLLGLIALGVGLLVTIPLSGIAMAIFYNMLKDRDAKEGVVEEKVEDVKMEIPATAEPIALSQK